MHSVLSVELFCYSTLLKRNLHVTIMLCAIFECRITLIFQIPTPFWNLEVGLSVIIVILMDRTRRAEHSPL